MRQKLSSRRGASLLIALLYFLVCGLVAAVIIGAAMTNVQKLKGARQRQQAVMALAKRLPLGLRASRAKAQIVLEETQEQPSRVRRGAVGACSTWCSSALRRSRTRRRWDGARGMCSAITWSFSSA